MFLSLLPRQIHEQEGHMAKQGSDLKTNAVRLLDQAGYLFALIRVPAATLADLVRSFSTIS